LPVSAPSNFTIAINGVKYGFSEEHGNGQSFCDANPDDPACKEVPPPTDKCVDKGIDPSTIPAYPNFPRTDWQGNPSHAAQGDMMKDATAVYKAKWWTSSEPGGADWDFVCNL
jgi:chitinase